MLKRLFDFFLASVGLTLLVPLFLFLAMIIKLTSSGPVFFLQRRVGFRGRRFVLVKFRTMAHEEQPGGPHLTMKNDSRVTVVGGFLRRHRLDELPQLMNIIKGEMSIVGPRPELERYVEMFREDYQIILEVRPGLTDYASIRFKDEAELMEAPDAFEKIYVDKIMPAKIELYKYYAANRSLDMDIDIILKTARSLMGL